MREVMPEIAAEYEIRNRLRAFVTESNGIEGILRTPTGEEMAAHQRFLDLPEIVVGDLERFVAVVAPGGLIRSVAGMNVRVGSHVPPRGGPEVRETLDRLLRTIQADLIEPWTAHCKYETLHPFMDGNGRSGRVLWAWHMLFRGWDPFALPFLHRAYYQALDEHEGRL